MKNLTLTICLIILATFSLSGQETLNEKYNQLLETTETYEQYKVIPRTDLNVFWSEVMDSVNRQSGIIADLNTQVQSQQAQVVESRTQANEFEAKLNESLAFNDSISFLGISFTKTSYHIMVWLIIVALAVLAVFSYLMYMRSNSVTSSTKREFESLSAEFDEHRNSARETQAKLKRDLQTAINKLNERR